MQLVTSINNRRKCLLHKNRSFRGYMLKWLAIEIVLESVQGVLLRPDECCCVYITLIV